MNKTLPISESLSQVFRHPTGSVVSLVDNLLVACRDGWLTIDWQNNLIRTQSADGDCCEPLNVSIPVSAFRAILARLAALCNEQKPGSVSPYGGKAELSLDSESQTTFFTVSFVNTTSEQRLELSPTGFRMVRLGAGGPQARN